jgi:tetratricopeptide (TPR) repeat protein
MCRSSVLLAFTLTMVFTLMGHTAKSGDKNAARKLFQKGLALVEERAYTDAVDAFRASFDAHPTKNALFNLATTYYTMARYLDALNAFTDLKERFGDELDGATQKEVAKFKRELTVLISELTVEVEPPNAEVRINGETIEKTPSGAILLDQGDYTIEASLTGCETIRMPVHLSLGEKRAVHIELEALQAKSDKTIPGTENPPPTSKRPESANKAATDTTKPHIDSRGDEALEKNRFKVLFWSGLAATGITGALTAGFLVAAKRRADDFFAYEDQLEAEEYQSNEDRDRLFDNYKTAENDAETYSRLGLAFGIVTGLLATTTSVMFVFQHADASHEKSSVSFVPNGVAVSF